MIDTWYVDTETIGFHGLPVLLQYAVNDGPVKVVHLWKVPTHEVVDIIREMVNNRVVAHNLRFDWFHISKLYNICCMCLGQKSLSDYPIDHIAEMEYKARQGECLKPMAAVDTLILAQRGEAQSAVMDANPIYVRRVFRPLAESVREQLEARTDLPGILFAGRPNLPKWSITERTDDKTGEVEASWVDIKLTFAPVNGLKPLCEFLLGDTDDLTFAEIAMEKEFYPAEEGYAPFAVLLNEGGWKYKDKPLWPLLVKKHIDYWATNEAAMIYAIADIDKLRRLYKFFGSPEEDTDSMIATQVASVRIAGFSVDIPAMEAERKKSLEIMKKADINVNSHIQVRSYISEALDSMEQIIIATGCDNLILEEICRVFTLKEEEDCLCEGGDCVRCGGTGFVGPGPMVVVKRAQHIQLIRKHTKRVELYDKLLLAQRAYPDFNVVGAKSGRMSGASGLNFQGVASDGDVRCLFDFADEEETLCGGDYDSQELAILATTSNDSDLLNDIKGGKSLHALMAAELFETTYEDIVANKDNDPEDRYGRAKSAVYLMAYGGTVETMAKNLSIDLETCKRGFKNFMSKYANMGVARKAIETRFTALQQGPDRRIRFEMPEEIFIETIYGFRRYFHNEYAVLRMIFELASNAPEEWTNLRMNVQRTEGRVQSVGGSIISALYGASFSVQNRIIRASMNHTIQSVGRTLTLGLQHDIWKLQPQGIKPLRIRVMTIHDESLVVGSPETALEVRETVRSTIRKQAERIPLISMGWATGLDNWYHLKKASDENCKDFIPCGFAEECAV